MAQPQSAMQFNPYSVGVCAIPTSMASDGNLISQQLQNVIPTPITTLASQQKLQRADRLEVYKCGNRNIYVSVEFYVCIVNYM